MQQNMFLDMEDEQIDDASLIGLVAVEPAVAETPKRPSYTPPERPTIEDALEVLRLFWGYAGFRAGQEEVIQSVLAGRDVVGILPTGAGKSVTFQVPAVLMPGLTIVVSPLISLMKDQIDGLDQRGIPAAFINSSLTPRQAESVMQAAEDGKIKLLYVAPERFDSIAFRERIKTVNVSLYAIDEAHCLSEWGHDFRPAYMRLGEQRALLGDPQIMALTATATPQVRDDIIKHLKLEDPEVHVLSFDRPNLSWQVVHAHNDDQKANLLPELLRGIGGSAVVYASTRKAVDGVADFLVQKGFPAVPYHAEKNSTDRNAIQEKFMSGEVPIIVATNAFGMGVDKDNVRRVIHWNFPGTVEAYYQEAGRAGRDNKAADCVMLYASSDVFTHEFLLSLSHPPKEWYSIVYRALLRFMDDDGYITVSQAEMARQMEWPKANPVSRCLQVLHEAGIVHHTTRNTAGTFITLLASTSAIKATLEPEARLDDRLILRELWRMGGGERLYRGTMIRSKDLATIQGELKAVRKALKNLARDGILSYKEENAGTRVLNTDHNPQRLPLPWDELENRRNLELAKLRRIVSYAETEDCRRGDLMRYFGDPTAPEFCGNCDNCRNHLESATK